VGRIISGELAYCLAGSSHHLIGGVRAEKVNTPFSFLPTLTKSLMAVADDPDWSEILEASEEDTRTTALGQNTGKRFPAWADVISLAASWMHTMPRPGKKHGVSGRFQARAIPDTIRGRETAGKLAAGPLGLRGLTIQS
jgi:hypothetical protein